MTRPYRKASAEELADRLTADWTDPTRAARELARRWGRVPSVVYRWAQLRGLTPPPVPRRAPTLVELQTIRELDRAGYGWVEIAQELGLHSTQALRFFEAAHRGRR
jgi:transposase-like protein